MIKGLGLIMFLAAATPAMAFDGGNGEVDFTGIVDTSLVSGVTVNSVIAGTYTINLATASSGFGSVSDPSWQRSSSNQGPASNVFSSTVTVDGRTFVDGPQAFSNVTVSGDATDGSFLYTASDATGSSLFNVFGGHCFCGGSFVSDSRGFPVLGDDASGTVGVAGVSTSAITYEITSISPARTAAAPELDSASMSGALSLVLGGIAVVTGTRRTKRTKQPATSCRH